MPQDIVPHQVDGYVVTDIPIADTEAMVTTVKNELGYDDFVYRQFERNGRLFAVYIAFWRPERRHFYDIGTHAPDNCWVQNGWEPHVKRPLASFFGFRPAEARVFDKRSVSIDVYYWHFVGGERIDYARYGRGRTLGFLFDNIKLSLEGRGEQYFVRISTNMSLRELERDVAFEETLKAIARYVPLRDVKSRGAGRL